MNPLITLTGILVLATLAEALVEYLVAPIIDATKPDNLMAEPEPVITDWRALVMRYTAALVGVLLCVTYQADLLAFFDLYPPWPWVGWVITGLLVGRGSNFVHDFASRWLSAS